MITYKELKAEVKMADWHDPWGAAMGWLFSICDYLEFETDLEVPDEWGYRSASGQPEREAYEFETLIELQPKDEDVLKMGKLLNRMCSFIERAGKDY